MIHLPYRAFLFLLSAFVSLILPVSNAKASHLMGSDIYYKCTSTPGTYEVTLVIYRNCDGGIELCAGGCGAACTQTMNINGADPNCASSSFGSFTLSLVSVRDINLDVNQRCPLAKSTCTNMNCVTPGSYSPGVERYEFKGFANIGPTSGIPASCCNVRFSWSVCCRNVQINTGSSNQNFYVDATINRCLSVSPCNSSPIFANDPFEKMCGGSPFIYNNGASDPDQDSLSFAFTPALQGYNSSVTYNAPWSSNTPMPYSGNPTDSFPKGIRCDAQTGDISFTPGNAGGQNFYGVLAVAVTQWKTINGTPTVLGTTRRDLQMVVLANCPPNYSPSLVTNPPNLMDSSLPQTSWDVCEGTQLCFDIIAKDTDQVLPAISDTTYLSWDNSLASLGATFLPNYIDSNRRKPAPLGGPRQDSMKFCWTPAIGSASNTPYLFSVKAYDSRCPNPGKLLRGFSIKVHSISDASITQTSKKCGAWQVGYIKNNPGHVFSSTQFQISQNPNDYTFVNGAYIFTNMATTPDVTFSKAGKYLIKLTLKTGTCTKILYDTLVVDTVKTLLEPIATLKQVSCFGGLNGSITLKASGGTPPYQYKIGNGAYDTTAIFSNLAAQSYTLKIKDSLGCENTITQTLTQPAAIISATTIIHPITCFNGNDGQILITTTGGIPPYTYQTDSGLIDTNRIISKLAAGMHTTVVKDQNGCIKPISTPLSQPLLLNATVTSVSPSCINRTDGSITILASGGKGPFLYNMDSGNYNSSNTFFNLSSQTYQLGIKDSLGCTTSKNETIPSPSPIVIGSITGPNTVNKNSVYTYSIVPQSGLKYQWAVQKGHIVSKDTIASVMIQWDTIGTGLIGAAIYKDTACGDTVSMPVTIGSTGLIEIASQMGLTISPNPTQGDLYVSLQTIPQNNQLYVYNIQGKLILQQELKHSQLLNLHDFPQGIYMLKVGDWHGKIVKD